MMRFKEVALSNASPEAKIAGLAVLLDKELLRLSEIVLNTKKLQGPQGEQGLQGPKGEQGDRGFDGVNGKDGSDGKDGKDGHEGKDGVGVADAKIDFDGSLVITLTNGREINAGDVVPEGVADKIKVIKSGGGNSQTVLDAIEDLQDQINVLTGIDGELGTMAQQNDTAVDINGGSIDSTAIGAAVPATGVFTTLTASALTATGQTSLGGVAGSESLRVVNTASSVGYWKAQAGTGTPSFARAGFGYDVGNGVSMSVYNTGGQAIRFDTNGYNNTTQAIVSHTASAVNYVQVTGAATANAPVISVQGSDSNAELLYRTKGIYNHKFQNGSGNTNFIIDQTAGSSVVNRLQVSGSLTGYAPVLSSSGSDTNISQVFQSKGTGAIDLAAGSKGVNISNGGTVTAITRTAQGSGYTSIPAITISAPTTAGGVQATANAVVQNTSATVAGGGTGYTVGDTVTMVGGTLQAGLAGTFRVSAVSGGAITAVDTASFSQYSTTPTNPVSLTGGTGTGATLNVSYIFGYVVFTNAGSGYVEQPTVSFSGGGGSGAAAYAVVGAGSIIRSLGSTGTQSLSFYVPSGEVLRLRDTGSTGAYGLFQGTSSGVSLIAFGATNATLDFNSNGTSPITFGTNGNTGNIQARISHTASAVNYVQVTGAATGGAINVTAQGSDTNIRANFYSKGTSNVVLGNGAGINFIAGANAGTSANYLTAASNSAGSAPYLAATGSDTNIDLTLTPKGTGNVRFGTLTASADAAITGYITIKDSGGTVRKLAVIA